MAGASLPQWSGWVGDFKSLEEFVFFFSSYLLLLLLLFFFCLLFFLVFHKFSFPVGFFSFLPFSGRGPFLAKFCHLRSLCSWRDLGGSAVLFWNPSQRLRHSLRVAAPSPRKYPGHKNPASYAGYHLRISSYLKILAFALIFFVLIFSCVQIIAFSDNFHIYRDFKVLLTINWY